MLFFTLEIDKQKWRERLLKKALNKTMNIFNVYPKTHDILLDTDTYSIHKNNLYFIQLFDVILQILTIISHNGSSNNGYIQ